jgi:cytochrome b561
MIAPAKDLFQPDMQVRPAGRGLAEMSGSWPVLPRHLERQVPLMIRNTTTAWGLVSRAFHWILGLAIIGMIAYGYWLNHWAARPDRFFHRSIHADIGYLILLLMAVRLIWRAINPTPALPADTPRWERVLAHLNHGLLYLITFVVALLGWAMSGAHKPDYSSWFGLFRVPQFTSENHDNAHFFEHWHIYIAYTLLGLIVLHLLAALYHCFIKRDDIVSRMASGA